MRLPDEQTQALLAPIHRSRVKESQGHSHIESWDVRRMLNRIFGFCGWSLIQLEAPKLVYQRERDIGPQKKPGFSVCYLASLAIVIHTPDGDATYGGSAIGESSMGEFSLGDCHDMALKTAESQALKRAATNLGDQFGLSLYDDGSLNPTVQRVVGFNPPATQSATQVPPPPPPVDRGPAPASAPPPDADPSASGGGNPVSLAMIGPAINQLSVNEKQRLIKWAEEQGIKNVRQPGDKVNDVLKRCEELVAARG